MNHTFINGLDLSELFYKEAVKPLLSKHYPDLTYSAALIGMGSEVLGFDTPQSTDHDWGPRLMLFLSQADHESHQRTINQVLRQELPPQIHGYPTNFGSHEDGTGVMEETDSGLINHRVMVLTVGGFFRYVLNFDPTGEIRVVDWISVPENTLLMLTAGRVFYDSLGELEPIREKLSYYPHEVWLYLLAAQWRRIGQEEAFMGRCGQVGDDLGSRLVASRLVRDMMRLCFLMERKYAPYIKWFGSAFAQLDCAATLTPIFTQVFDASSWEERQTHLSRAYEYVAQMHNDLGITAPLPTDVSAFHNRPFLVIHADRFMDTLRATIQSEEVLALPDHLGGFDQFIDSTDAQNFPERFHGIFG
ncbi:MAG: DUF4037 domain-containing protein [Chloroflexota bacterium]